MDPRQVRRVILASRLPVLPGQEPDGVRGRIRAAGVPARPHRVQRLQDRRISRPPNRQGTDPEKQFDVLRNKMNCTAAAGFVSCFY